MSLIQFLRILMARRMIVQVCLAVCVLVAVVVANTLPERYSATARVLMDIVKPDPVTGLMVGGRDNRSYIGTQMELIKDYRVAGDVVERLGWPQNPSVIATWQAETGGVGDIRRWGAQRIIDNTKTNVVTNSNIMEIIYEAPNPEVAKTIVSMLREAYIDGSLRFDTDAAGRNADWYREQTERARAALSAAEAAKTKFEQENGIVMTGNGEAETAKLASLQASLLAVRSGEGEQQFQAEQRSTTSAVIDQLKIQLAAINDQMQQSAASLGVQHPTYKALTARRDLLARQLSQETQTARQAGAAQSGAARTTVAQAESAYNAQKAKVLGMKDQLDTLSQLQREVELRQQQYQQAAAKTADLRLQSSVSESPLVILGDAFADASPSFPKWPQVWGLSAAFGLGLGILLALLTELLTRRVRGPEDLRFASKVPVLAVIADAPQTDWRDRIKRLLTRRSQNANAWQGAE
jgi:succinoglycan biosynthesis transport protein ExoP